MATRRRHGRGLGLPLLLALLHFRGQAAAAASAPCPLGSVTVNGVTIGVPTTPLDWCLGANVSVRPNTPYTMVGVTITPQGDSFLNQHGRDLWKYLDIRTDVAQGTTGTIFENLFGMTYAQYAAIPAVQSNPAKGINNQAIVYLTPKDLAKVWILTTDGDEGVTDGVPTAQGGYASAAGAIAVAGQESGGQNPGSYTYKLNNGYTVQFNSPITALDPVFAMNPQNDDGQNGGFWQVSNFATTPSVLPCFIAAGWQGSNMADANSSIIYNPFFQAKIAMFWATKKINNVVCTSSDHTPCKSGQLECVGTQWIEDQPNCLAGPLCKGQGIWNAPLVDAMFNILTGTDQTSLHCNGMTTSLLAQHGTYLAALDLLQASPPYVPTAPSSWVTDANFNVACQNMPRFVEVPCTCGDPCFPAYMDQCSSLPYWPKPTGNGRTCGGQNCLTYQQPSLGGFPVSGVPSARVTATATILAPARRRLLLGEEKEQDEEEEGGRRHGGEEKRRRLPTLFLDNLVFTSGLCTNTSAPTLTVTAEITIEWPAASFADQVQAFIAQQASQNNVTICSVAVVSLSYPSLKTCKSLVEADKASALTLCGRRDRACRKAVQQAYRVNMGGCKTAHKFCVTTAKGQKTAALRACKQQGTSPAPNCRANATAAYKQHVKTC